MTPETTKSPLMIGAAIAIIVFCGVGTAAVMGWIPTSMGNQSSSGSQATQGNTPPGPYAGTPSTVGTLYVPPQPSSPAPASNLQYAQNNYPPAGTAPPPDYCSRCGTVESIREITVQKKPSGLGMVGGALVGGLLGHQLGGGRGNTVTTVAGAAGGAYVGNRLEQNHDTHGAYEVRVHLQDGSNHVVHYNSLPPFREGDRIRYDHGHLEVA